MGEALDIVLTGCALHIENIVREVVHSARALASARLYSTVAIVTIALAIGANITVASVVEAVLLRPLPYAYPSRLVFVSDGPSAQISYANATQIARENQSFSQASIRHGESATMFENGRPARIEGSDVSAGYFEMLGVHPQLGRTLRAGDTGTVMISDRLWRGRFGADPDVLRRSLRLGKRTLRIVGVAPSSFQDPSTDGLETRDYWEAIPRSAGFTLSRDSHTFDEIARLKDGVSLASANADVRRIVGTIARQYPSFASGIRFAGVSGVLDTVVRSVRTLLWLVYAAVLAVLAIACVNVANLALVRVSTRMREFSVRAALGASSARITLQFSTESFLLAVAGATLGVLIAAVLLHEFNTIGLQLMPRWNEVRIDARVSVYALALVVITTLATGLLPALRSRRGIAQALRTGGRNGDSSSEGKLRRVLVCAEISLAVIVVLCAGLLLRSFERLVHVNLGFDASRTYFVAFSPPDGLTDAQTLAVVHRVQHEVMTIPGVVETALAGPMPYTYQHYSRLTIPGRFLASQRVSDSEVSAGFFHLLRIPLLRGRDFGAFDTAASQPVAIVDAAFARRYFGTLDVVGRVITPWRAGEPEAGPQPAIVPRRIVGIVGSVRRSLAGSIAPTVYLPISQVTIPNHLIVRTMHPTADIGPAIDAAFMRANPQMTRPQIARFEDLVADDVIQSTASVQVFSAFAALALLLALAGIFAVTAESVAQRTREFGIRKAVGARERDLLVDVILAAGHQSLIGFGLGLALAVVVTRQLAGLLFQTSALDPIVIVCVAVSVIACSSAAALLPALRAARFQPALALRYE
jgi:predicted permease